MQTRGKLADRPVADLLEWIHGESRDGVLRFWHPTTQVRKDVFVEKGEIVSSGTSEPREFLGSFLIAEGKIGEKDFVRAYRTQVETKVLFGKVLAMFGLVSEKEVEAALKRKTEETIWDVFLWPDGVWELDDGQALSAQRLPIHVDIAPLIAEGERRVIEWGVVRKRFPDLQVEVAVADGVAAAPDASPTEKRIFDTLRAGKPLAQAALESRLSTFLFLRKMAELEKRGRVRIVGAGDAPKRAKSVILEPLTAPVKAPKVDAKMPPVAAPAAAAATSEFDCGKGQKLSAVQLKSRVPVINQAKMELLKMKFTPEEGYVLSRVDGVFDVGTVVSLCPFRENVALERIASLASRGVVTLQTD